MLSSDNSPLAGITYLRGFDIDDLLMRSCGQLRSLGLSIGGVIQRSSGDRGRCAASIHVVDLRSGETFDIWESRGACARGCRLDERGLMDAEPSIMGAIADGVDLIVINRFGRAESLGRGLAACFAAAMEAGLPVLTAVRAPYGDAWRSFQGGLAQELPSEASAVVDWSMRAASRAAMTGAARSQPAA
jgi:molybdate transport system ATP-binding protein